MNVYVKISSNTTFLYGYISMLYTRHSRFNAITMYASISDLKFYWLGGKEGV
jgi:hypothetical protein